MVLISVLFLTAVILAVNGFVFHETGSPLGRVMAVICLVAVGVCAWQWQLSVVNRVTYIKAAAEGSAFIVAVLIVAAILKGPVIRLLDRIVQSL